VLTDDQLAYAADDVRHLHALEEVLRLELSKAGLEHVFKLETELIPIVVAMEKHGFALDTTQLQTLEDLTEQRRAELAVGLRVKFGESKLNLDSPEQLLGAFDKAGLKLEDTSESTLVRVEHELATRLLQYRQEAKLLTTIKNLRKHVLADGRIHSEFNPLGADTGRFSAKHPNLQNVTRGTLRGCFVPAGSDRRLVVADYSQIELRIAAYFARDKEMLAAFQAR